MMRVCPETLGLRSILCQTCLAAAAVLSTPEFQNFLSFSLFDPTLVTFLLLCPLQFAPCFTQVC